MQDVRLVLSFCCCVGGGLAGAVGVGFGCGDEGNEGNGQRAAGAMVLLLLPNFPLAIGLLVVIVNCITESVTGTFTVE